MQYKEKVTEMRKKRNSVLLKEQKEKHMVSPAVSLRSRRAGVWDFIWGCSFYDKSANWLLTPVSHSVVEHGVPGLKSSTSSVK